MKLVTVNVSSLSNDSLISLFNTNNNNTHLLAIYPNFDIKNNLLKCPVTLDASKIGYLNYSNTRILISSDTVLVRTDNSVKTRKPETNLPINDLQVTYEVISISDVLVFHFGIPDEGINVETLPNRFICTLSDLRKLNNNLWKYGDLSINKILVNESNKLNEISLVEDVYIGHDLLSEYQIEGYDDNVRYIDSDNHLLYFGLSKTRSLYSHLYLNRDSKLEHISGKITHVSFTTDTRCLKFIPVDEIEPGLLEGKIYLNYNDPNNTSTISIKIKEDGEISILSGDCELYPDAMEIIYNRLIPREYNLYLNRDNREVNYSDYKSKLKYTKPMDVYGSLLYSENGNELRLNEIVKELLYQKSNNPYIFSTILKFLNDRRPEWKTGFPETTNKIYLND